MADVSPDALELLMKKSVLISLFALALATLVKAQQEAGYSRVVNGAASLGQIANLPVEKIGPNDLLGITVYDEPELTRTVRIGSQGELRLPMLKTPIQAAGLYPAELEKVITQELVDENVLVEPIVTISVAEYRSRPISVVGSVKNPVTFQATGTTTLLDAISLAQGLTDNAGSDILISRQPAGTSETPVTVIQRIPVHKLIAGDDPTLNVHLEGGEEIRVPEAGRVFVVGNVKKPGAFNITDGSESSVMKALSLSEGLESFSSSKAYIYRLETNGTNRDEIAIELRKILKRQSPDVPLVANDILYIPDNTGLRASVKALETIVGAGASLGAASIYTLR